MQNLNAGPKLVAILLIDDDAISRELVATLLGLSRFTVETAEDGAAALTMLSSGAYHPEVILLDAQMPGLSGAELIVQLRARSNARIVLISASQPAAPLRASADGFLLKPFTAAELGEIIEKQAPGPKGRDDSGGFCVGAEAPTYQFRTVAEEDLPAAHEIVGDLADPVVSTETLAQLRSIMPLKAVREIFAALVADLDRRMEALDAAITAHDGTAVRRIGHAIKGGAAMAGAVQLAGIGARIEAGELEIGPSAASILGAERNQLDNGSPLRADLSQAAANLRRMLEEGFSA
jgi:CheY-like chemotaxis protein